MSKFDTTVFIAIFIVLITIIALNTFILKFIIKRAIKKIVIPKLESMGLIFIAYQWAGFFPTGNFKPEISFLVNIRGSAGLSIYAYVQYLDKTEQKRITIQIDTLFYVIKRVNYSNNFS